MLTIDRTYSSKNYDERPEGVPIKHLMFHYTDLPTAQDALAHMLEPAQKVSAHYLIDEEGKIYELVAPAKRAWHAGTGQWRSYTNLNHTSLGIELQNKGHSHGYHSFPLIQIQSLIALSQALILRYKIAPYNILGHSDYAPHRKQDPGAKFPWRELAQKGVGFWPPMQTIESAQKTPPSCEKALSYLREIGYDVPLFSAPPAEDDSHPTLQEVLLAFQRRFLPSHLSGSLDSPTATMIAAVHYEVRRLEGQHAGHEREIINEA